MQMAALATLAAIVDSGSFATAAERVGCTASAVSLRMKQLENYFGRPLFDRSSRSVKPTPLAVEIAAVAHEFGRRIETLRTRPAIAVAGRIRLGAIASVQTDGLPQALRRLRDTCPALEVAVFLDDSSALLADLQSGRIEAAVLIRPQSGGSTRLLWQNLTRQPFVMLAPPDVETVSPSELLQRFDWIRYDTSLTGGRIAARYVREVCPRARPAMELRSIDAVVAMVSAGLGVSIVPRPRQALLDAHGVREVNLGRKGPRRQIAFARRSIDADDRNLDAVHDALASAFASRT